MDTLPVEIVEGIARVALAGGSAGLALAYRRLYEHLKYRGGILALLESVRVTRDMDNNDMYYLNRFAECHYSRGVEFESVWTGGPLHGEKRTIYDDPQHSSIITIISMYCCDSRIPITVIITYTRGQYTVRFSEEHVNTKQNIVVVVAPDSAVIYNTNSLGHFISTCVPWFDTPSISYAEWYWLYMRVRGLCCSGTRVRDSAIVFA